jgi:mono/diheme cytochrome c family protein
VTQNGNHCCFGKGAHILRALLVVLPCLASSAASAQELAARGHKLLSEMCASCHAIERSGASPHPAAPPFRRLSRRLDLESFSDRLREGLLAGHRDMPAFRFSRDDARAIRAYLLSIDE